MTGAGHGGPTRPSFSHTKGALLALRGCLGPLLHALLCLLRALCLIRHALDECLCSIFITF